MWMLFVGFPDEMWMLQQPNMKLSPSSSKKKKKRKFKSSIKRLARQAEFSHHVSESSDQMIRFNLFLFLRGKRMQFHLSRTNYQKFHSNGKRSRFQVSRENTKINGRL